MFLCASLCVLFSGVDFAELYRTAAQMKKNDETFPRFEGGELDIFQQSPHYCSQPQGSSWQRDSYQQSAPTAASSPNEEWPPSSQTQSEATGEGGGKGGTGTETSCDIYCIQLIAGVKEST